MLFSQRKGLTPVKDVIQKECMDDDLRFGLWNALHTCLWENNNHLSYNQSFQTSKLYLLFQLYWHSLFKFPIDNLPGYFENALKLIRKHFFECEWYEAYDFIEFTAQNCPDELSKQFVPFCNQILEIENSAYRFVDKKLTDLTSEEEIESIEAAIKNTSKYSGVSQHLKTALKFLTDRKSPDYRNSVK
ncbi:AbiJ-NTD4 domain-containing protein [Pseudoalteromonas sp. M58]|uniref:AbiJ-NTD4 domain-containing protein n=1 Tax=Pseudoalteromonas sp. M58 TaxID=3141534 RepID=UPI00366BC39E